MKQNANEKRYYSISEVARMTGLEPYVLRYWEKEFSMLRPRKNRGGNRLYTTADIELINRINYLRKQEKLTIAGARTRLTMRRGAEQKAELAQRAKARTLIGKLRKEVEDLLKHFT
ncbi:MAG: MerR family transcriptional regulator [Candidatus Zixiibacteriota bacterium]|nr:MAG: MerR family transcriptional regulator [candidate division Zixibacteria bacterium]